MRETRGVVRFRWAKNTLGIYAWLCRTMIPWIGWLFRNRYFLINTEIIPGIDRFPGAPCRREYSSEVALLSTSRFNALALGGRMLDRLSRSLDRTGVRSGSFIRSEKVSGWIKPNQVLRELEGGRVRSTSVT